MKKTTHITQINELETPSPRVTGQTFLQVLGGSAYGGGTEVVLLIVRRLLKNGNRVDVVATDKVTVARFREIGANVIEIHEMVRAIHPVRDALALVKLVRLMRSRAYDVVHTHTSKAGVLGRTAAWLARVPLIVHHIHGFAFHDYSGSFTTRLFRTAERIASRMGNLMISVNEEDRERAIRERIVAPENIVTIANGVREELFERATNRNTLRKQYGFADGEQVCLFVGRLFAQKDPATFLRAAALVSKAHKKVRFLVVGEGPDREAMETLAKHLDLGSRIEFLGFRADVADLLTAADVFVLTSKWEGLPISILEAMARSCPIVATSVKGTRELIRDGQTGLLVPPENPAAAAEGILKVLLVPAAAAARAKWARHDAKKRYSEKAMLDQLVALYARFLKPPRKAPCTTAIGVMETRAA